MVDRERKLKEASIAVASNREDRRQRKAKGRGGRAAKVTAEEGVATISSTEGDEGGGDAADVVAAKQGRLWHRETRMEGYVIEGWTGLECNGGWSLAWSGV